KKRALCPFHDDHTPSFSVYTGKDGTERWTCYAGCGEGSAIDFLKKLYGLTDEEACREFIRLAGVMPVQHPVTKIIKPPTTKGEFDWNVLHGAVTDDHRKHIAEWRGYSPQFIDWLHGERLFGVFNGKHVALPVADETGRIVGCHVRLEKNWIYHPSGTHAS